MKHDVAIIGGGPGGLSAALALGRARKRVVVFDAGTRRNAMATHLHNFVTRDGSPPDEFRRIAWEQLRTYPNVELRETRIETIAGRRGAFRVGDVEVRRVLLAMGMIDEMLPIDGFREHWGTSIFQCPYCHGWEVADRPWGVLASPTNAAHLAPFAIQARAWSAHVTVFTHGMALPDETRAALAAANIRIETAAITRVGRTSIEVAGTSVPCEALFAHTPQRQVALVGALGVALDDDGFVKIDPMKRETSVPGVYAAGDLTTRMQGAIMAAAAGVHAAANINLELTMELVATGQL